MSVALHIWVSIHHMIVCFVAKIKNDDISSTFFIFSKIWFSGLLGGRDGGGGDGKKRPKMTKTLCLTLHLRNCTSCNCGFWYTCVKWWYLQHFIFFFHFFKIVILQVFQSSSINAKRIFWGVPYLLHMCVVFH